MNNWKYVRIVPASQGRVSLRTFWAHQRIDQATKSLFGIEEVTDDISLSSALEVGEMFERAFEKVQAERFDNRASRKNKVKFPVQ